MNDFVYCIDNRLKNGYTLLYLIDMSRIYTKKNISDIDAKIIEEYRANMTKQERQNTRRRGEKTFLYCRYKHIGVIQTQENLKFPEYIKESTKKMFTDTNTQEVKIYISNFTILKIKRGQICLARETLEKYKSFILYALQYTRTHRIVTGREKQKRYIIKKIERLNGLPRTKCIIGQQKALYKYFMQHYKQTSKRNISLKEFRLLHSRHFPNINKKEVKNEKA